MRPVRGGLRGLQLGGELNSVRLPKRESASWLIVRLGSQPAPRSSSSLDKLSDPIAWTRIASLLEPLYPASKGEPARPPLAVFKALLLFWYDLPDVKLAEALEDRASFPRFCGFSH